MSEELTKWDSKVAYLPLSVPAPLKQRITREAEALGMSNVRFIASVVGLADLSDLDTLIGIIRNRYRTGQLTRVEYAKLSVLRSLLAEIAIATQLLD